MAEDGEDEFPWSSEILTTSKFHSDENAVHRFFMFNHLTPRQREARKKMYEDEPNG